MLNQTTTDVRSKLNPSRIKTVNLSQKFVLQQGPGKVNLNLCSYYVMYYTSLWNQFTLNHIFIVQTKTKPCQSAIATVRDATTKI